MADNNPRPVYSFSGRPRIPDFCFPRLPRCSAKNHLYSAGSFGSPQSSRGDFVVDFEAGHRPSSRQSVPFVVPDLCYPQMYRGSASNPQLEGYQCLYSPSALSYGDSCSHSPHPLSTGLGGFDRPQGCFPPRTGSSFVPLSSRLSVPGTYLSVSGPSFRPQGLPVGVHPSGLHSRGGYLRCRVIRIHYYLDDCLIVAFSRSLLLSHLQESLLCAQSLGFLINWEKSSLVPSQVPIFLGAVLDFPRLLARPADHRILALIQVVSHLVSSPLAAVSGSLVQSQGLGCGLPLFDASSPDFFPAPLPSPSGLPRPPDSFVSTDQGSLSGVGFSRLPSCRETVLPSHSYFDPDRYHRRFQPRLGCFVTPSSSFGSLVASGLQASYQPSGAQGSLPGSSGFSVSNFRSVDSGQIGEFDGGCVYQLSRRNLLDPSVLGDSPPSLLVPPGEDCSFGISHSGSAEFGRGLPVQGNFLPSEWSLHPSVFLQILRVSPPPSRPWTCLRPPSATFFLGIAQGRPIPMLGPWTRAQSPGQVFLVFVFPPFALLPRVLEKVALDQTALLLVTLFWPKRPWFSRLLFLLSSPPRSLPVF